MRIECSLHRLDILSSTHALFPTHLRPLSTSPHRAPPPRSPSSPSLTHSPPPRAGDTDTDSTASGPAPKRARRAAATSSARVDLTGAASSDSDQSDDGKNPDRSYKLTRQERAAEYESDYDLDDADPDPDALVDPDGDDSEDDFVPDRSSAAAGSAAAKGKGKAKAKPKAKGKAGAKGKGKAAAAASAAGSGTTRLKLSSASASAYGADGAASGSSSRLPVLQSAGVAAHEAVGALLNANIRQDRDYGYLPLRPDQASRPFYIVPSTGHIILENFHPLAKYATDFLVAIAEPVSRPRFIHEYKLTPHSLYAAVSVGLETENIIEVLNRMSKVPVPDELCDFIRDCTHSYGKVKMVLKKNKHFVESTDPETLRILLRDDVIAKARVPPDEQLARDGAAAQANGTATATFGLEKDKAPTRAGLVIPGTSKGDGAGAQGAAAGQKAGKDGAAQMSREEEDLFTAVVGLDKGASPLTHSLSFSFLTSCVSES